MISREVVLGRHFRSLTEKIRRDRSKITEAQKQKKISGLLNELLLFYTQIQTNVTNSLPGGPDEYSYLNIANNLMIQANKLAAILNNIHQDSGAMDAALRQWEIELINQRKFYQSIEKIRQAKTATEYVSLAGLISRFLINAWSNFLTSLVPVVQAVGQIFPPVMYFLDAFIRVCMVFFDLWAPKKEKLIRELTDQEADIEASYEILESTTIYRTVLNGTVAALDMLAVLAFVGALPFIPIWGWAFVAGGAFVGWLSDSVYPTWKAYQDYKLSNKLEKDALRDLDESELEAIKKLDNDALKKQGYDNLLQAKERVEKTRAEFFRLRTETLWGFAAVVGTALVATGPFGLTAAAFVGTAIVGVIAIRGVTKLISTYYSRWKEAQKQPAADIAKSEEKEEELEINPSTNLLKHFPPFPTKTITHSQLPANDATFPKTKGNRSFSMDDQPSPPTPSSKKTRGGG